MAFGQRQNLGKGFDGRVHRVQVVVKWAKVGKEQGRQPGPELGAERTVIAPIHGRKVPWQP